MSSVIDYFGQVVGAQIPTHPVRARMLLTTAYAGVAAKGALDHRSNLDGVINRFIGRVADYIVRGLRHPSRSVLVNIFMPCEIFDALGLVPLFPEGLAVYLACSACSSPLSTQAENLGLPKNFCSYHKVMLGLSETGIIRPPCFVAATSLTCDANQLSFRQVASKTRRLEVLIDVPRASDEIALRYLTDQLFEMTALAELLTGSTLSLARLNSVMENSIETLANLEAFRQLRGSIVLPMSMTGELCTLIATHCLLGTNEAKIYSEELLAAARKAPALSSHHSPRIYWMHTLPNWQMSLRTRLEDPRRAELVGCDIADDYHGSMDIRDPFRALALRLTTNSHNGSGARRIERVLEEATLRRADGIVIFGHSGCKQTLGLSGQAQKRFEIAGFPTLVLDGDGCDPRNVAEEAMLTRLDAFLESLGARDSKGLNHES